MYYLVVTLHNIICIPKKNCQSEMILPIFLPNFFIDFYPLHRIKDSITQLSINKMKIELLPLRITKYTKYSGT